MWRSIGLYSFLSLNLGFMIVGGFYLGQLVERNYQLKNGAITGALVGMAVGFYEMFKVAFKAGRKR